MSNHVIRESQSTLGVRVSSDGRQYVINVSGELDMGTRHFLEQACSDGEHLGVVVEMAELTFMDCCGYSGLVAARRALEAGGRSLTLRNQAGQPARLMALLGGSDPLWSYGVIGATSNGY